MPEKLSDERMASWILCGVLVIFAVCVFLRETGIVPR